MNIRKYIVSTLVASALAAGAYAQTAANPSDLVVGFAASGGTGAATNIEIDLGSATNFIGLAGGTYTIGTLNTSLTNIYGSGWGSRSDLSWGVVGSTGNAAAPTGITLKTIWASSVETGGTYPAPAWTEKQSFAYTSPNTNISAVYNGMSSGTLLADINGQSSQVGNVQLQAVQISTSTAGSWTAQQTATPLFGMATFASGVTFTGAVGGANLDLYQNSPIASGSLPGTNLGYFSLSGTTGVLTFTVPGSAIPEPSTYAAILGVAALGFVMIRRRQQGFNA